MKYVPEILIPSKTETIELMGNKYPKDILYILDSNGNYVRKYEEMPDKYAVIYKTDTLTEEQISNMILEGVIPLSRIDGKKQWTIENDYCCDWDLDRLKELIQTAKNAGYTVCNVQTDDGEDFTSSILTFS